jgi:hypothetical protein
MRLIAVALSAFALAGCGEEAKPAAKATGQTEVERTLDDIHAAVRGRSAERLCALYSTSAKQDMQHDYGTSCEETLQVALDGVPDVLLSRKPEVGRIDIKGDRATVTARGDKEDPLVLVREGRAWRIYRDAPPAAVKAAPECVDETGDTVRSDPAVKAIPDDTVDELVDRLCARGSQAGLLPLVGSTSDEEAGIIAMSVVNDLKGEGKLTQEQALALLK